MISSPEIYISVIVPIYNAELYLLDCIQSIIRQSFTDWELILVDDGSKDNTGKITLIPDEKAKTIIQRIFEEIANGKTRNH